MNTNRETIKLYWAQIRKHRVGFFVGMVTIPLAALFMDTALPYLLSQSIGQVVDGNFDGAIQLVAFAAAAAVLGVLCNLTGFQTMVRHEANVRVKLIDDTMQRLLAKDADFFANQKVGSLTGKFIDFINAHIGLQDLFVLRTLSFILTTVTGITLIALQVPLLAAIIAGLVIFVLIQIRFTIKLRRPYREARKKLHADVNGAAADAISNNTTVKTFAQESHEKSLVGLLTAQYRAAHIKDLSLLSAEGSTRLFITGSTQIVAVIVMINLIASGTIDVGIAIFALAYLQRFAGYLFVLGELINGYDRFFLQAAPMTEILHTVDVVKDTKRAKAIAVTDGAIGFNGVSYAYQDAKDITVLDDIDLTIKPGQKVGLVGHSGAGKTTITKLLLRFADVTSGHVTIDAQDISSVTQNSLRRSIAYVPQEPLLFHRSLRDNIAYARPNASDQDIRRAAGKANALDFIDALPNGLETIVGERGIKLSGGQRQRIAIARAILKDAPILILDEATSALDSVSEQAIQDSLRELMSDRTSIVVAHRLSTIQRMDRIIVLEAGRIIEDGSHAELLARGGTYADLWKHQSGGFISE